MDNLNLGQYGINVDEIHRNLPPKELYDHALKFDPGSQVAASEALIVNSGAKTGRSPKDKRVVKEADSKDDIWWGDINRPLSSDSFSKHKNNAIQALNKAQRLYIVDGLANWSTDHQYKVRIICTRPYHALFMHNMLIRPNCDSVNMSLEQYGEPDYVIYNAGTSAADQDIDGVDSETCVALSFAQKEMVIMGTQYAGEMKKGVFTIMNYIMPKQNILSMHCSANVGKNDDLCLFFGLSGTGKTTLSAQADRELIGDDEHCWSDNGVFNIEGGCYAKCIDLSREKEPEIWDAIKFGTVLENVVYDSKTRQVDYSNDKLTQNTRASYPIDYIHNIKMPCVGPHPKDIVFLTCDAFGVLPPISRLNSVQAMYHFISGYTAKVAGTEMGVVEPEATFSACFGAAFMVWHPSKYAELLAAKMQKYKSKVWLVNTGWTGGSYGSGHRISLKHTRSLINAVHSGDLNQVEFSVDPIFGFEVPKKVKGVPSELLWPKNTWAKSDEYDKQARELAKLFKDNFKQFEEGCSQEIIEAGPKWN